ncbi:MAG: TonB-dependent receptor, partial [Litorilituus sp.]|nr:TonB-dependent receptor [Litorilituus sp.]
MKTHSLSRIAGALVVALGLSTSAMANETSSGISGQIMNPKGNAAINTTITVTHIPTGITKTVKTNESGHYNLRGLKVGGPYKIVIDSETFKDQEHNNIYLTVGKPLRFSTDLEVDDVERIQVTGSKIVGFTNKGSSGSWGAEEIINAPGGSRDLKDVLRSNPLVTVSTDSDSSMSIAGSNPRYNSFTVDGVKQNDDFGLNGNGYPTQRSPISIDAIAQVSVETTPFSARNGGFSGGQVNAVTKSGTNEFHGSLSYEKDSSDWAGDFESIDGKEIDLEFESTNYAFTLGGPIIEDELFFFLSYDKYDAPTTVEYGPKNSNAANPTGVSLADYERVRNIAQSVYGVDAGTWDAQPEEQDEKLLVKIDWNINDDHRAAFTYQNTEGNVTRNMTSSENELKLSTHWYNKNEKLETLAAHLYSTWSDDFSSEIKLAWKDVDTEQAPNSKAMGDVTIETESGNIALGPDKYRHGNALTNTTISFRALGEYLYNDHEISFGLEYDTVDVMNLFAPDSLGVFTFYGIDDFEARNADYMSYKNAYTNNVADAEANFKFTTTALFVEDLFYITDDIILTAGLRY